MRLFDISTPAASVEGGWFGTLTESNCIALHKRQYTAMGGYDPRFDAPGGGLANLDFFARICERFRDELVVLLGEGTFHQVHGGAATSDASYPSRWMGQYERIRGAPYKPPRIDPYYFGRLPAQARRFLDPGSVPGTKGT